MMRFYNNIFGGTVYFLNATKNFDPEGTSVYLIAALQFIHFVLLVGVLGKLFSFSISGFLPSKYFALFLTIPWILILFKYYSKSKREKILTGFNQKSTNAKMIWSFISLVSFVIPLVLFSILFHK